MSAFFLILGVFCLVGAMVAAANGETVWYYLNIGGFFGSLVMAMAAAVKS